MSHIKDLALQCRGATRMLATLSSEAKRSLLESMAAALEADAPEILTANAADLEAARAQGVGSTMLDRLSLDPKRLASMADALRDIAVLPDPVGQVTREDVRPNGLRVQKVRVPLGVIAMIYEARPNVTADAAALCIKAGNGVILRGGSEAIRSNLAIAAALKRALRVAGVPEAVLILVEDTRRQTMLDLLQLSDLIDLVIPRGGEGLIRFVTEYARVPVIKHYKGVCHQFVDASADIDVAVRLLMDGKTTRPSACNALETLLVHADIAARFLPTAAAALRAHGVEVRGDQATRAFLPDVTPA
ncbi:MAG TPA: glutamate-5-semialdehyde dehydrogenase, partial [Xylella sp.]